MSEDNETVDPAESDSSQEPTGDVASGIGQEISATVAKLGAGEKFAVLGAATVLAGWLLFDLLIDDYSLGHLPFALAVVLTFAAYKHHTSGSDGWPVNYRSLVWAGAALLGLIGVWALIEELRNGILDDGVARVVGALVFYGGSIVSGIGAWQLKSSD